MGEKITLKEAERRTSIKFRTLLRWAQTGRIKSEARAKGSRTVYVVDEEQLCSIATLQSDSDYKALYKQWIDDQRSGYHTGKPLLAGIRANEYGMAKYLQYLDKLPKVEHFTAENLRLALSKIPIDYAQKKCHFTQKDQMYKAVLSFSKLLVRKQLRVESDLAELRKLKPKRVFPPQKVVLKESQLDKIIEANDEWLHGRTEYDRVLFKTLIMILAYAGLRRAEMIKLEVAHLDFELGIIKVVDGKGHKNRVVGMVPELQEQLKLWLSSYRPPCKVDNVIVGYSGYPITETAIMHRFKRLSDRVGFSITSHGLRRTFATLMENRGMPWSYMQKALGHSDIQTTQGYVMTDDAKMVDWLRNYKKDVLPERGCKKSVRSQLEAILSLLEEDE
jgi:integrase